MIGVRQKARLAGRHCDSDAIPGYETRKAKIKINEMREQNKITNNNYTLVVINTREAP